MRAHENYVPMLLDLVGLPMRCWVWREGVAMIPVVKAIGDANFGEVQETKDGWEVPMTVDVEYWPIRRS